MKRRDFLKVSAAGAAATAVASPAIAQSSPEIKWRLTSSSRNRSTHLWRAEQVAKTSLKDRYSLGPVVRGREVVRVCSARATSNNRRDVPHRSY